MTMPRKVAVIGAGEIGVGWAALCASAGWPVAMFDMNPRTTERAFMRSMLTRVRSLTARPRAWWSAASRSSPRRGACSRR